MEETTLKPTSETNETTSQTGETFFNSFVGINEAATISLASKGQISRDTTSKKLPYTLNDKGQKRYKVADLYQQYGFRDQADTSIKEPEKPQENSVETIQAANQTAIELAVLKERVSRLEGENLDLRQTRDRLLEQNTRLTLLLPAPPIPTAEPISSPAPSERKSLWKRLFS